MTDMDNHCTPFLDSVYQIRKRWGSRMKTEERRGIVAGVAALVWLLAGGAAAPQDTETTKEDDIVVTGKARASVNAGLWEFKLSRSFAYGQNQDRNLGLATGRDSTFRFCLPNARVDALVRALAGEGRTETSGNAVCSQLNVEMNGNTLIARQTCSGLTMPRPESFRSGNASSSAANGDPTGPAAETGTSGSPQDVDMCGWNRRAAASVPAAGKLTVQGKFTAEQVTLNFMDEREPLCYDPQYRVRPDGRRWTMTGTRVADCDAQTKADPGKP